MEKERSWYFKIPSGSGAVEDLSDQITGDLRDYVEHCLDICLENDSAQEFDINSPTTEIYSIVHGYLEQSDDTKIVGIANRLMREEKAVQAKIEQLKTNVLPGNLLLTYRERENTKEFRIIKVDSEEFLDDSTLTKRTGPPDKPRIFKSCLFQFNSKCTLMRVDVYMRSAAVYWHDAFLELTAKRTAEQNTRDAFNAIDSVLKSKVKNDSPGDYAVLRNSILCAFRSGDQYDHSTMLSIVSGYEFSNATIKRESLLKELSSLPDKKHFDRQFQTDTTTLRKRYLQTEIPLRNDMALVLKSPISDFKSAVFEQFRDGQNFVIIQTDRPIGLTKMIDDANS